MPVLRQLPRWAWFGTAVLAFIAGLVNAAGYLGFRHESISNMTGNTSLLGIALGQGDAGETVHWALAIASFVFGTMLSGMIVQQSTLKLGRRYGVALVLESLLLFAAVPLLDASHSAGLYLASVGMGLQNGMVSTYSGAVIRTTHVSGLFTDLGTMLGARLRGHPLDMRKATLFLLLISGFVSGGSVGAYAFQHLQFGSLLIPAGGAVLLALIYWIYRYHDDRRRSGDS